MQSKQNFPRMALFVPIIIFVILADQFSKWLVVRNLGLHESVPFIPDFLDFLYIRNQQETMTNKELKAYIQKQKSRGSANLKTFEVEYHKRFASPFAAFILSTIGMSISCRKRKGDEMIEAI